jgi:hypothetical protein
VQEVQNLIRDYLKDGTITNDSAVEVQVGNAGFR